MISPEGQRIRNWLSENLKNAPRPSSIQEARAGLEAMASQKQVVAGSLIVPVMLGSVPGEWVSALGDDSEKVILYLHGGGYTMGSLKSSRAMVSELSSASGINALVVDYRLAPEHPFPAAVEDSTAAYRRLLDQGTRPDRVVIVGDSSGGGLALALLVTLRDSGIAPPAAAVLLSPWTDLAGTGESMITRADVDPWLTPDQNRANAALYAGETDLKNPLVSPLYADLGGLPPLLIHVGGDEIMLDDSTRLADRARAAGVEVTLDIWEGMWHAWHHFAPKLPEAVRAIEQIGKFIREKTV
jgi:acetyl esterase/lipase